MNIGHNHSYIPTASSINAEYLVAKFAKDMMVIHKTIQLNDKCLVN